MADAQQGQLVAHHVGAHFQGAGHGDDDGLFVGLDGAPGIRRDEGDIAIDGRNQAGIVCLRLEAIDDELGLGHFLGEDRVNGDCALVQIVLGNDHALLQKQQVILP